MFASSQRTILPSRQIQSVGVKPAPAIVELSAGCSRQFAPLDCPALVQSLPRMARTAAFSERFVVVLQETQDIVNIAGTMRAMMNMGLYRLRLVKPALFDAHRI